MRAPAARPRLHTNRHLAIQTDDPNAVLILIILRYRRVETDMIGKFPPPKTVRQLMCATFKHFTVVRRAMHAKYA